MNRRRAILTVGLVLILAVALVFFVRGRERAPETAIAQRGSIDVTIQTVGTVQIPDAPVVRARAGGVVAELGVAAGDRVAAGDILIVLEQEAFDRGVLDAENLRTQAEYALQLAELRAAANPDDEALRFDVLSAADRLERAERAVSDAERARRDSIVVAPSDGVVVEVQVRRGDAVGQNQVVARITSPADFRLVADVDEPDLPNVRTGAEARIRLDAFPATELTGEVLSTAPLARQQGGATVFATTIAFVPDDSLDIRPGMNADVTIVTEAREGVLLIPDRALRTVGERSFVEVQTANGTVEREVTLGYRGLGQVEVVQGLSEGERVVLR
jgi:RND family efflux transporter MFP subunit